MPRQIGCGLSIHYRSLPHWQQGGSVYFVTFRVRSGLLSIEERQIVVNTILRGHPSHFNLLKGVVMPDHVHLILQPAEIDQNQWRDLGVIMKSIKGTSARAINRVRDTDGTVWMSEYFDRVLRDDAELLEKLQYIENNPLKAKLVSRPEDYPFYISPP